MKAAQPMYRLFPDCMVELAGKCCAYGSVHTMTTCPPDSFVLSYMTGYFFDVVHCRYCFSLMAFETFSASRCRYIRLGTSQILQPEFIMERERNGYSG